MFQPEKIIPARITEALNRGATIITANKRLAGVTRQLFERTNMDKGIEVWPTPQIFPWSVWLKKTWEEAVVSGILAAPALLLTPQQELCIWKNIITKALADAPLLQVNGTACQAQQAWQLMQAWQLALDATEFSYNRDSMAFNKWATEFEALCLEKNWLSISGLSDVLYQSAKKGKPSVIKDMVLFGFDELTLQQQSLLSALTASGCNVNRVQLAGLNSKVNRVACHDSRHEAETVARWARQCIKDHPLASIGIIIPELQSKRNTITQVFDTVLLPQSLIPGEHNIERPYNVSLGLPLSSYPVIQTALQLLGFLAPTIRLRDAGMLLRSPFIHGWQQEASARSLLDAYLRKEVGELDISLKTLRYYANKQGKNYCCPELVKNIDAWNQTAEKNKGKKTAAQWAENFSVLLKTFDWTNGRTLSSEEYQTTEVWRELLINFASLDAVTDSMTEIDALSQLRTMANNRIYQPQTGSLSIQILGVLEAEEMQFDYLWVMGLHDGIWPSPPHANPFIPLPLQKAAGLPHSSEEKALQLACRATERLLSSANEVFVSYPQRDGDNKLRISSLIRDVHEITLETLKLSQGVTWIDHIYHSAKLDVLAFDPAPPLGKETAKGGSSILKHQANCPFRAFAELRLKACYMENPGIGLNSMAKGILIHKILERVWTKLETQENLLAMESSGLNRIVRKIINEEVDKISRHYPQTFTRRFKKIESERLCSRVMQWLELEKQRPPFRVIATEEEKYIEVAEGVTIKVIIDRIDELDDGRKLVLDYKTGKVEPKQWFNERPGDPQLPLYSMLAEGDIAGVAFAQVRANEMAFKGVTEESGLLPGVSSFEKIKYTDRETWADVLEEWEQTMRTLAAHYQNGNAAVDPKNKLKTCENTYCNLKPLCRINELTTLAVDSAEKEAQQ